jgi:hypothetical protein
MGIMTSKFPNHLKAVVSPELPFQAAQMQQSLAKGETVNVEGTNVVRVPFGVRKPRRTRPERPPHWATLVIPLQSWDPTPPPQAA